jgi:hypothetical protein
VSPTERSIQLGYMLDQAHKHKVGANNHNFTKREERYYSITTKHRNKESFRKEDFGDLGSIEYIKMKEQSWSVVGHREDGDTRSFH